ncbi:MAG: LysM peptidoglycan-binding domain-containing protein, partial [Anaerolineae bacterium]|nr:LysM peptidoglycan-binding domain-containing protein [Anaerolineae bacterium]
MIYRMVCGLLLAVVLGLPASFVVGQDTPPANSEITIHVVQRDENLFRIALSYGLTVDELAQLNGIVDPSSIQVGQRLLVPVAGAAPVVPQTHTVQPGETLQSVAALYGLTVDDLVVRNNLIDANRIFVGQVLTITSVEIALPPTPEAVAQASPPSNMIHIVLPGETLFRIATSYGVSVNDVASANGITDPTLIYAGQQLMIPGVEVPQLALDLPSPVTSLDIQPLVLTEGQSARFHLVTSVPVNITGAFLGQTLMAASGQNNTDHTILVGIPVFADAGVYPLQLSAVDNAGQRTDFSVNVSVVGGDYGSEIINLMADRSELLDPAVEDAELQILRNVASNFTPTRYFAGPLGLPAAAPVISPFGTRRSYNNGAVYDHFHSGTDFAG